MNFFRKPDPPPGHRLDSLAVEPDNLPTRITVLTYESGSALERSVTTVREVETILEEPGTHWVHAQGLGDAALLTELTRLFRLEDRYIEEVLDAHQRPIATWLGNGVQDDGVLAVLRAPWITPERTVELDHISVLLRARYVLTVQDSYSATLQPLWDRIVRGDPGVRDAGAPALTFALVDRITDSFYPTLEETGDRLEELEDRVMEESDSGILAEVNRVRSELVRLRRVIWPQREAIHILARNEMKVLPAELEPLLRDCYEHCLQTSEIIESYRELVGAINGTYLAAVSNRTNEVMRVLTIMASIFIPLTFIAGIYGMNFENMPELKSTYGYVVVWVVMLSVAAGMIYYFQRRGWISLGKRSSDDH